MKTGINDLKEIAINRYESGVLYDLLEEGFYETKLEKLTSQKKQIKFLESLFSYYFFITNNFQMLEYKKLFILNTFDYINNEFEKDLVTQFKKNIEQIRPEYSEFFDKIDFEDRPFRKLVLFASCSYKDPYILKALIGKNDEVNVELWSTIIINYEKNSLHVAKIL